jgi:uncharacterized 2Fe-2S/4Fe-4S cluster protein (DUF4445 family)
MSPVSAERIGLIPRGLAAKTKPIGNAALLGASMLLLDGALMEKAATIANLAQAVELASSSLFSKYFTEGMMFPDGL